MEVTLYSTHCPQCVILERVLRDKHVAVNVVADMNEIQRVAAVCGYTTVPMLKVGDIVMSSVSAIKWANAYEETEEVSDNAGGQVSSVQEGPELHQEVLQCAECGVGQ